MKFVHPNSGFIYPSVIAGQVSILRQNIVGKMKGINLSKDKMQNVKNIFRFIRKNHKIKRDVYSLVNRNAFETKSHFFSLQSEAKQTVQTSECSK